MTEQLLITKLTMIASQIQHEDDARARRKARSIAGYHGQAISLCVLG
jgi:hypothetical protein